MRPPIAILSGPSGVGKDTVLDAWLAADRGVARVVTATTRAPRPGEVEGRDYCFLSLEEFRARIDAGEFLEWKEVHGNLYGSPVEGTERILDSGKVAVLKIDVHGALEVMPRRPEAITIFLLPPSDEELARRIRQRGTEDPAAIEVRLANARDEIARSGAYRHRIVNDDLEETVRTIREIVWR